MASPEKEELDVIKHITDEDSDFTKMVVNWQSDFLHLGGLNYLLRMYSQLLADIAAKKAKKHYHFGYDERNRYYEVQASILKIFQAILSASLQLLIPEMYRYIQLLLQNSRSLTFISDYLRDVDIVMS